MGYQPEMNSGHRFDLLDGQITDDSDLSDNDDCQQIPQKY